MLTRFINRSFSRLIHYRYFSNLINEEDVNKNTTHSVIADSSVPLPLIISTSGVPIHLYTRELEAQALKQLIVLAESGIVKGFVAAMADVHVGEITKSIDTFIQIFVFCFSRRWCNYWNSFCFSNSCKSICCWC